MFRAALISIALLLLCAVAACQQETVILEPGANTANAQAAARAACEEAGGTFTSAPGDSDVELCVRTPQDANQPCSSSDQCDGLCLARSRTCAPFVPLLGCNEALQSDGTVATVCIE